MHKILLADDEEMIRELIRVTLSRDPNLAVTTAANGREALERAREIQPQLVILDVRMPEMDGYEVCRHLRAEGPPGLFIMMLTAMSRPADIQAGKVAGADDYFVKPFSPAALLRKVYDVIERPA